MSALLLLLLLLLLLRCCGWSIREGAAAKKPISSSKPLEIHSKGDP